MKVRVCDLDSNNFREEFLSSLLETGFAVVTNHGIKFDFIKETQDRWRKFFTAGQEYKDMYINHQDSNMGYTKFGGEKAVGAKVADLKEFFHWKMGAGLPTETVVNTMKMFSDLNAVSYELLSVIDSYTQKTHYLRSCVQSDNTIIRALYYPAVKEEERESGAVRAAAHEDINFITLLVAASAPGLQVRDAKGIWYDVPHEENSIVVNIGDMLQLASGGLFKSTTHRVSNPSDGSDRVSIPLFIHPHSDTILADGITAQQYLTERLQAIYKAGYEK